LDTVVIKHFRIQEHTIQWFFKSMHPTISISIRHRHRPKILMKDGRGRSGMRRWHWRMEIVRYKDWKNHCNLLIEKWFLYIPIRFFHLVTFPIEFHYNFTDIIIFTCSKFITCLILGQNFRGCFNQSKFGKLFTKV
jgi:hypothetical protein